MIKLNIFLYAWLIFLLGYDHQISHSRGTSPTLSRLPLNHLLSSSRSFHVRELLFLKNLDLVNRLQFTNFLDRIIIFFH